MNRANIARFIREIDKEGNVVKMQLGCSTCDGIIMDIAVGQSVKVDRGYLCLDCRKKREIEP